MKHELRVMQAQGAQHRHISSTYGHEGGAGASVYVPSSTPSKADEVRCARAAHFGVRVNAVGSRSTGDQHADRFTGTPEGRRRWRGSPAGGAWPSRKRSLGAIVFLLPTRLIRDGQVLTPTAARPRAIHDQKEMNMAVQSEKETRSNPDQRRT